MPTSGLFRFLTLRRLIEARFQVNRPVSLSKRLSCVSVKRISAAWKSFARTPGKAADDPYVGDTRADRNRWRVRFENRIGVPCVNKAWNVYNV